MFRPHVSLLELLAAAFLVFGALNPPASAQEFYTADASLGKPSASPAAKLQFKTTNYADGTDPQWIAVGDFNKDGKLDFANVDYSNGGAGFVSVFLGKGNGTFEAKVDYPVGNGPDGIAAADVDGDGKLDLVVANDTGASVSVLIGNGDGTFKSHQDYAAGSFPHWISVGDFNGDKKPDLVVTNEGQDSVGVFINNGDGTFKAMESYPVSKEPYSVAVGDFNRDGKIDLAVTGYYSSVVSVLLGKGNGTFKPHVDYLTGVSPAVIEAADINHDGKLDLVTVNYNNGNDGTVSVLLGKGDGSFETHIDSATGAGPDGLILGDFNGDGKLDAAVANLIGNSVSVLLGEGDGSFQTHQDFPLSKFPLGMGVGGFSHSGSGSDDLVVTTDLSATVTVFLNEAATRSTLKSSPNPSKKGQAVTFTASFKAAIGKKTPTGTVTFKDGKTKLGTVKLSTGVAKFTTDKLSVGTQKITAEYSGDRNFNPGISPVLRQKVNP